MTALGWCYAQGQGVEQDRAQAVEWYRKGAAAGDEHAKTGLRAFTTAKALVNPVREPDQGSDSWARQRTDRLNESPWVAPPPIRAQWEDLTGAAVIEVLAMLRPQFGAAGLADELDSMGVQRIRSTSLSFYKSCSLVDLQLRRSSEDSARFVSALVTLTGAALLDGKVNILHAVNPYLLALTSDE